MPKSETAPIPSLLLLNGPPETMRQQTGHVPPEELARNLQMNRDHPALRGAIQVIEEVMADLWIEFRNGETEQRADAGAGLSALVTVQERLTGLMVDSSADVDPGGVDAP